MPKLPPHVPGKTCHNYPICKKTVPRLRENGVRIWQRYCGSCLQLPMCPHPGCSGHVAPVGRAASAAYCAPHLCDPAHLGHSHWTSCKNAVAGCRYFPVNNGGHLPSSLPLLSQPLCSHIELLHLTDNITSCTSWQLDSCEIKRHGCTLRGY